MIKRLATIALLMSATSAMAVDSPITGVVEPKCSIWTETNGVYGHPLPYKLTTKPADGGVKAITVSYTHLTLPTILLV